MDAAAGARPPRVLCFATQGTGSADEDRIRVLLERLDPTVIPFDRSRRATSAARLAWRLRRERPDIVVMEGTGVAGVAVVLALRTLAGIPYVVSSGDSVAPFVRSVAPHWAPAAWLYERLLCAGSAGFVAWSPYLAGRAITLGARRTVTAANWAADAPAPGDRAEVRAELGIDDDTIVFGIVGSLAWNPRRRYCYGLELVRAVAATSRPDVRVLVVGDGDGRRMLEAEAGDSVLFTGRVPRADVARYLAAVDVASLPQSVDQVGAVRYTTKLSDYLAAGLPIVTGRLPLAYDLDDGWIWRLPGEAPWDPSYVEALGRLMNRITLPEVAAHRRAVPSGLPLFDRRRQQRIVADFVRELVDDRRPAAPAGT